MSNFCPANCTWTLNCGNLKPGTWHPYSSYIPKRLRSTKENFYASLSTEYTKQSNVTPYNNILSQIRMQSTNRRY